MKPTALVSLALTLAAGCGGGQVGEEPAECRSIDRAPIGLDETTPLGFSAGEVLGAVAGEHSAAMSWADESTATVTLSLAYQGEAHFHEQSWSSPAEVDPSAGAEACGDVVELLFAVDVETSDGALDESWTLVAPAATADRAHLRRDLESVSGTYDHGAYVPDGEWESVRSWIELDVGASGLRGVIAGQVSRLDGDTASAEGFDIATLGDL